MLWMLRQLLLLLLDGVGVLAVTLDQHAVVVVWLVGRGRGRGGGRGRGRGYGIGVGGRGRGRGVLPSFSWLSW